MMDNFTPNRIVKITWGDAWHDDGGKYLPNEFEKYCVPIVSVSVGTVLFENEKGILLSGLYDTEHLGSNLFRRSIYTEFIPRGLIIKVEELVVQDKEGGE